MTRIVLDRVTFGYRPAHPVLNGLSLEVAAGQIVGLLGRNGAGKTTTFRILTGLLRPDSGSVTLDGISASADPVSVRRRTAFLPDTPLLYDRLSAEENMNMFGLLWGVDPADAATRSECLLREAGLWEVRDEWVRGYSAGMQQRLAICAALIHEPTIIVMDEPLTGLDVDGSLWGRQVIRARAAGGASILFSSHIPELIENVADVIAVLDRGVIAGLAPIADVRRAGGAIEYFNLKAPRLSA